ncbi:MAG: hypothetical protein Q8Q06_03210 [bacterium]|nr:hypothetical protein [bacterium]
MPVELKMRPNDKPISWEEFTETKPNFSIAIDGYVAERPRLNTKGPYANFNHHEGVSRLETRATCAQIHLLIRLGLFRLFRNENGPMAHVWTNDCDEDVCLSWYLLSHNFIAESMINPCLNRLVDVAEIMDTTAGMYPLSVDVPIQRQLAWVMEPYRRFRFGGAIDLRDADSFINVVTDVCTRIEKHIIGDGKDLPLDTRYKIIGGGQGWSLIEEIGNQGRQGAFSDGIRAFVSARERDDGKWSYSIGRASECIPFDVLRVIDRLNKEECVNDTWGGSSTIGGSPRITGSSLSPDKLIRIINDELKKD